MGAGTQEKFIYGAKIYLSETLTPDADFGMFNGVTASEIHWLGGEKAGVTGLWQTDMLLKNGICTIMEQLRYCDWLTITTEPK